LLGTNSEIVYRRAGPAVENITDANGNLVLATGLSVCHAPAATSVGMTIIVTIRIRSTRRADVAEMQQAWYLLRQPLIVLWLGRS
jgi:hypothetical protein